jgi:hypothetical protein
VAAILVAGVRGEPCGAVRWTLESKSAYVGVYQLLN